jgi:hypothetical protein
MNSIKPAWPFVPMVKYAPSYAKVIGKWMLNNASACRLFFPQDIDEAHQWAPELRNMTNNNISYEGLRRIDDYGKASLKDVTPVAIGDGPKWIEGNPVESMFSVYSSSPVGIFGAIIKETNVEGILQLDCNVTDFYSDCPYPAYLYYNPYAENKQIEFDTVKEVDLFDIVSKKYVAQKISGKSAFEIPAKEAQVLVVLPSGTKLKLENNKITANGKVISYK